VIELIKGSLRCLADAKTAQRMVDDGWTDPGGTWLPATPEQTPPSAPAQKHSRRAARRAHRRHRHGISNTAR